MEKWFIEWPPRDWRSFIALIASVGGGVVAFVLGWRVMTLIGSTRWYRQGLNPQQLLEIVKLQLQSMEIMAKGSWVLMALSIVGLWFVLGRRSITIQGPGGTKIEAGGGSDDSGTPPPVVTTTTTTVTPQTAPVVDPEKQ